MRITWAASRHEHPEQHLEHDWPLVFWNGTGFKQAQVEHTFRLSPALAAMNARLADDLVRVASDHSEPDLEPRYDPAHPDFLCYGYTRQDAAREHEMMRQTAAENVKNGINPMMGINMAYPAEGHPDYPRHLHEVVREDY